MAIYRGASDIGRHRGVDTGESVQQKATQTDWQLLWLFTVGSMRKQEIGKAGMRRKGEMRM